MADALSRILEDDIFDTTDPSTFPIKRKLVSSIFTIKSDPTLLKDIRAGYKGDPWCVQLNNNIASVLNFEKIDDLCYTSGRLVIPRYKDLCKQLFHCAHDGLGHFGFEKLYGSLRDCYYWPNMRRDLEQSYVLYWLAQIAKGIRVVHINRLAHYIPSLFLVMTASLLIYLYLPTKVSTQSLL